MAKIKVSNLNKNRRIILSDIKKLASFVAHRRCKKKNIEINIVFLSDAGIKKLNRKYKHRDRATDVLCFCLFEGMPFEKRERVPSADIYISSERAFLNAKRFNTSFKKEIYLYVIHGILHASGLRDSMVKERKSTTKL